MWYALLTVISITAHADMWSDIYKACKLEESIKVCRNAQRIVKDAEKEVKETLEEYGMESAAVVTATATRVLVERKVKLKTGKIPLIGDNRSDLEIESDKVILNIKWDLP